MALSSGDSTSDRSEPSAAERRSFLSRARRLRPEQLRWRCDPDALPCETTAELEPLSGAVVLERAAGALSFGLEMALPGFNLCVVGLPGAGRTTMTRAFVERFAGVRPVPSDWCYVYNFKDPDCPRAIGLPAGQGKLFAREMEELIEAARREIDRFFELPEYRQRRDEVLRAMEERREQLVQQAVQEARAQDFALSITATGVTAVPLVEGRRVTPEEYDHLPEDVRLSLQALADRLVARAREVLDQVRRLERAAHDQIADLDRQAALFAIGPFIRESQARHRQQPGIVEYLSQVQEDLVAHVDELAREARGREGAAAETEQRGRLVAEPGPPGRGPLFERYRVNVVVDNGDRAGAPVVFEPNPTYANLVGRIEYRVRLGTAVTDFQGIKAGALHRANGGYLIVRLADVLASPNAWDALKRALRTGQIRIESPGDPSTMPTVTLLPEPIPVDVKVVLIAAPALYHLIFLTDEDCRKLFKVKVDLDIDMERTPDHMAQYCAFVCRDVQERGLRHFHRSALARILEYGARLAEHQGRLSTQLSQIADLAAESSYWAAKADSPDVLAEHVDRAIEQKINRSNFVEERLRQLIAEGTILLDTAGARVGQVNGLSILDLGDYSFGRPVRVTAQTALGSEGIVDVQREARLSGPIHNKGFQILTGFLAARYAQDKPLALAARITFEQTYDEVEGDSASSTEVYALLSSLADLPLRQGLAVTGSINQHGELQAVGGITRKVEGFFAVCKEKGLTGAQGVIIPEGNVKHLMLRDEIVEAVRAGQFHLWAVRTIDEGIEILTGVPAGRRRPDGSWEEGTVNDRVDRRLRTYAEYLKSFAPALERPRTGERPPAEVGPRATRLNRRSRPLR